MRRFIVRRLLAMVLVMFATSVAVFAIFNVIPGGDPALRMAGKNATAEQVAAIRRDWGFDDPLPTQYVRMMEKTLSGDLISYTNQENVVDRIREGLPHTLSLTIFSSLLMLAGGIALGMASALRPGSAWDRVVNVVAITGVSLPVFWTGALMSYYLGSQAGIIPAAATCRSPMASAAVAVAPDRAERCDRAALHRHLLAGAAR